MSLDSVLELIESWVTEVTRATAITHADLGGNSTKKSEVTRVTTVTSARSLVTQITSEITNRSSAIGQDDKQRVTPVSLATILGVTLKPLPILAVTSVAAATPKNGNIQTQREISVWGNIHSEGQLKSGLINPLPEDKKLNDTPEKLSVEPTNDFLQRAAPPAKFDYWSESEVTLAKARAFMFHSQGIPTLESEELACSLVIRDRENDDRRLCFECASLIRWRCQHGLAVIGTDSRTVLHRCHRFSNHIVNLVNIDEIKKY